MTACLKCIDYESKSWNCYSIRDDDGEHWFNVDAAIKLVQDGRKKVQMPTETLLAMVAVNQVSAAHVYHIDRDKPGIIAFREQNDGGFYFIDGSHRAARCLAEKQPFFVYTVQPHETPSIRTINPRDYGGVTVEEADEVLRKIGVI